MESKFEAGTLDKLVQKLESEGPEYRKAVDNLISACYKAAKTGLTMNDIASLSTMGWMMSENPELEGIYHFILSKTSQDQTVN